MYPIYFKIFIKEKTEEVKLGRNPHIFTYFGQKGDEN